MGGRSPVALDLGPGPRSRGTGDSEENMRIRAKLRREEGAAAVEFALIAGLLFMLIFGMIEYGFAFFQMQTLRGATREGARVAAVGGTDSDISTRLVQASAGALPSGYSGWTVTPSDRCDTGGDGNEAVTVRITNGSLPPAVQQAFSIDVPFLPH
jgi:Flp pilus assembly protein TadG